MKEKVGKEEADEMKKVLEAVGGTVEIEVWKKNIVQLTIFGIKIYIAFKPIPFLLILLIKRRLNFALLCSLRGR